MPQIQIPDFVGQNQAYAQERQNALLTKSRLATAGLQQQQMGLQNQQMGMETQNMARSMQKRAELEALLAQSQNPERDGYEWAKRNDPELANKLAANYVSRFAAKARLDPKNAAMELENATGEKIELGNRFSKLPVEGGEAYVDNFSGHVFQPSNAKELADIRNDFATKMQEMKGEQARELYGARAEADSLKLKQQQEFTASENEKNRQNQIKAAGISQAGANQRAELSNRTRLEAATIGKPDKPLSGEASKVFSIATTMQPEIEQLKAAFKKDYRGSLIGIVSGTNRKLRKLAENVADKVGRIRSGGAVNPNEENRFMNQLGSWMDIPFGNSNDAISALDGLLAESRQITSGIDPKGTRMPAAAAGTPNRRIGDTGWNDAKESRYQELLRKRGGQ